MNTETNVQQTECGQPTMFPGKRCALESGHPDLCSPFPRDTPVEEKHDPKAARAGTFERLKSGWDAVVCAGCKVTHSRGSDYSSNQPVWAISAPVGGDGSAFPPDALVNYCHAAFMALSDEEAVAVANAAQARMSEQLAAGQEKLRAAAKAVLAGSAPEDMPPEQLARGAFRKFLRERGHLGGGACGICERGAPARVAGTCENCWAMLRCAQCEAHVECEFHKRPDTTPEQRQQAFMRISKTGNPAPCRSCGNVVAITVDGICGACFIAAVPAGAVRPDPDVRGPASIDRQCALCGADGRKEPVQISGPKGGAVCQRCIKGGFDLLFRGEEKDKATQPAYPNPAMFERPPLPTMKEAQELALALIAKAKAAVENLGVAVDVEEADAIMTLVDAADHAMKIGR